jgi:hypothetical protein
MNVTYNNAFAIACQDVEAIGCKSFFGFSFGRLYAVGH